MLAAVTVPASARICGRDFVAWGREVLDEFEDCCADEVIGSHETSVRERSLLQALEIAVHHAEAPLQRMEHSLERPVAYVIMPLFALANAGARLGGGANVTESVSIGIIFGLVVGKQLGVTVFTWLDVRRGLAALLKDIDWRHINDASWLAGIGYTMALFTAGSALKANPMLNIARVAILLASAIAGVGGWLVLRSVPAPQERSTEA